MGAKWADRQKKLVEQQKKRDGAAVILRTTYSKADKELDEKIARASRVSRAIERKKSEKEQAELAKKREKEQAELAKKWEKEQAELVKKRDREQAELAKKREKEQAELAKKREKEQAELAKKWEKEQAELVKKRDMEQAELAKKEEKAQAELAKKKEKEQAELAKKEEEEQAELAKKEEEENERAESTNEEEDNSDDDLHADSDEMESKRFAQEPFSTYREKVLKLLEHLGFQTPTTMEHLWGGGYNRIIRITMPNGKNMVLRIPRDDDHWTSAHKQWAGSEYLLRYTSIPVPAMIAYDNTYENELNSPYFLQECMPGTAVSFWLHCSKLSISQRMELAVQLADWMYELEKAEFSRWGGLEAKSEDLPSKVRITEENTAGFGRFWHKSLRKRSLNKRLRYDINQMDPIQSLRYSWEITYVDEGEIAAGRREDWVNLNGIYRDFQRLGWLNPEITGPCIMMHPDMFGRNIMGNEGIDEKVKLSGLIDLDAMRIMPRVYTRRPPHWLWIKFNRTTEGFQGWDGDPDDIDHYELKDEIETDVQEAYHNRMRQNLGSSKAYDRWFDDLYGTGRWIRRLYHIHQMGLTKKIYINSYRKLVNEWWNFKDKVTEYYGLAYDLLEKVPRGNLLDILNG